MTSKNQIAFNLGYFGQDYTKSKIAKTVVEGIRGTRRGFTLRSAFHVSTATTYSKLVLFGIPKQCVNERIANPLSNVAVEVIQSPWVRLLQANRVNVLFAVLLEPSVSQQLGRVITEIIVSGRSCSASVFPLYLRGQSILVTLGQMIMTFAKIGHCLAKRHGIEPGNVVYGQIFAKKAFSVINVTWIQSHDAAIDFLGYEMLPHPKPLLHFNQTSLVCIGNPNG